jgi:hypothetical protein
VHLVGFLIRIYHDTRSSECQSTKTLLPRTMTKLTTYLGQHRDRKVGYAEHKLDGRDLVSFPFSAGMFILIKKTLRDYLVA